jgi:hypothetical protein
MQGARMRLRAPVSPGPPCRPPARLTLVLSRPDIDGPNGPMGDWRSGDAPEWNDTADDEVRNEEESWQISRSARSSTGPSAASPRTAPS